MNPSSPSPKVVLSTLLGGVLIPALIAVGTYVLANQDVLGINNPVLGVLVVTLISGAVTFLSGYLTRDPLRDAGVAAVTAEPARSVELGDPRDANGDGRDDSTGRFI